MNDLRTGEIRARSYVIGTIGFVGLVLSILGWILNPRQFYLSYLCAEVVWLGVAMGCLAFLMIHYLTGGQWGWPLRRIFEAAANTLPFLALMFVPVVLGARELYPWAGALPIGKVESVNCHQAYLNLPLFVLRAALFFCLWTLISWLLSRWSREQDVTGDLGPLRKIRKVSGPALAIYPLTITVVFVDWVMSLEKDWFSTIFPILVCIGQMLSGLAFVILVLAWLGPRTSLAEVIGKQHFHQLGSLLLAFVMLWAYLAFSQLLIIWSGDLPHEITWYLHRIAGSWRWVLSFLVICHFFGPFFLLLSRQLKQSHLALAAVASVIFLAHVVDVWWMIVPTFYPHGIHLSWIDAAAFSGVGGAWCFVFLQQLNARPLVALNDPRFALAAKI